MSDDPLRDRLLAAYAGEYRDHVAALRAALSQGGATDLEEAYRHAHSLKGAARAVELPEVVDLAHGLESLLQAWWEEGMEPESARLAEARAALDAIEDVSAAILARDRPQAPEPVAAATLRVEVDAADRLAASTGHLLAELERQRRPEELLRRLGSQPPQDAAGLRRLVRELSAALDERDWTLSRAAQAVAADVTRLRMVTAEGILGNFGPMLRALAAEQGKDIRFAAHGLATQADREVLTTLAEAVLHLLRNAVAHGVEPIAERRAAGKDATASLTLRVATVGPRLEVRVADDGAGIAVDRLAREAVARGILSPAQAERAEADTLRQLVFHPGLSTAGRVSTTAGRGMGMAIVRRLVDRLQGDVLLHSQPGRGTEVVMSVPVTVLAQRVVLVRAAGQTFGLPAPSVVGLLALPAQAVVMVDGGSVAVLDERELPLAELGALMGLGAPHESGANLSVALVRVGPEVVGLAVDGVEDVRDLQVSPFDPMLVDDPRLVGTVTLEGGALALVLSPAGLRAGRVTGAVSPRVGPPRPPARVLVVDDSPTIRSLERTILEAHSYRVDVAVDGRDALERMERLRPDLVVSDIEMPRLDGLGLLAAMRADARLADLPVVLVSSRADTEARQRAAELGAQGYVLKTRFDQREFLDIIGRLTA